MIESLDLSIKMSCPLNQITVLGTNMKIYDMSNLTIDTKSYPSWTAEFATFPRARMTWAQVRCEWQSVTRGNEQINLWAVDLQLCSRMMATGLPLINWVPLSRKFAYHQPICACDRITFIKSIREIFDKKNGAS